MSCPIIEPLGKCTDDSLDDMIIIDTIAYYIDELNTDHSLRIPQSLNEQEILNIYVLESHSDPNLAKELCLKCFITTFNKYLSISKIDSGNVHRKKPYRTTTSKVSKRKAKRQAYTSM